MRLSTSFIQHTIVAFLGVVLTTSLANAQEYKIKLDRPLKAGDQYNINLTATIKNEVAITANGNAMPKQGQDYTTEMLGLVRVVEVSDKNGLPKKLTCKVDRFTKNDKELYPAGTIIAAEIAGGKPAYTVDGKPVGPMDFELFATVLELADPDTAVLSDEALGTDQPKKVGDTWPLNADKESKAAANEGVTLKASDIKGESKLVKAKKLNGVPVLVITTQMHAEGFAMDIPMMGSAKDGKMTVEQTVTVPVDDTQPVISKSQSVHLKMSVDVSNGAGSALITSDREVKEQDEPVRP